VITFVISLLGLTVTLETRDGCCFSVVAIDRTRQNLIFQEGTSKNFKNLTQNLKLA